MVRKNIQTENYIWMNHILAYDNPFNNLDSGDSLVISMHITCNQNDAVWLRKGYFLGRGDDAYRHGKLAPHRYCRRCGLVKVEGDRKGHREGYYFSLLGRLKLHLERENPKRRLTKVDVRLICQEIRSRDLFTDPYGSPRSSQDRAFVEIVLDRRGDLNPISIREFVISFRPKKGHRPRST